MKNVKERMRVKMAKTMINILIVLLSFSLISNAQDQEGSSELMIQPRKLIDSHTAGVLPRAHFDLETRIYPNGDPEMNGAGMAFSFSVGITDRLNLGGGYGGDGVISRENPKGNPYPFLFLKYRILEESFIRPAVALGFDPTGYGGIENDSTNYKGFIYKSQGFFIALSKNYLIFKKLQLGIHGSVNFSVEDLDNVTWPNVFLGTDLSFNEELAISVEYNMALNQVDKRDEVGDNSYANPINGFFNVGLRWNMVPNLYLEFLAKDAFSMKQEDHSLEITHDLGWSREIKIVYVASFLNRNRDK